MTLNIYPVMYKTSNLASSNYIFFFFFLGQGGGWKECAGAEAGWMCVQLWRKSAKLTDFIH